MLGVRRWSRRMLYWCIGVCLRCLGRSLCFSIDVWSAVSSGCIVVQFLEYSVRRAGFQSVLMSFCCRHWSVGGSVGAGGVFIRCRSLVSIDSGVVALVLSNRVLWRPLFIVSSVVSIRSSMLLCSCFVVGGCSAMLCCACFVVCAPISAMLACWWCMQSDLNSSSCDRHCDRCESCSFSRCSAIVSYPIPPCCVLVRNGVLEVCAGSFHACFLALVMIVCMCAISFCFHGTIGALYLNIGMMHVLMSCITWSRR
jgi:hypothetical protein